MFPADIKTKRKTGLEFDRLLQIVGCVRMLLHTRWQALSGRKRKSWARQRLQCVHPNLAAACFALAPFHRLTASHLLSFLVCNCDVGRCLPANMACCMYCVPPGGVTWAVRVVTEALGDAQ